jgi:hypothetical protein
VLTIAPFNRSNLPSICIHPAITKLQIRFLSSEEHLLLEKTSERRKDESRLTNFSPLGCYILRMRPGYRLSRRRRDEIVAETTSIREGSTSFSSKSGEEPPISPYRQVRVATNPWSPARPRFAAAWSFRATAISGSARPDCSYGSTSRGRIASQTSPALLTIAIIQIGRVMRLGRSKAEIAVIIVREFSIEQPTSRSNDNDISASAPPGAARVGNARRIRRPTQGHESQQRE